MSSNELNNFSIKLYNKLAANKNENFFISPFSISTALSMCHAGAKNDTAKQLKELLSFNNLSDEQILEINNKYLSNINSNLGSDVVINTANKIYPNHGFEVKQSFTDLITKHFRSGVQQLNYANAAESAKTINDWVAEQTKDKIKDLISADNLNEATRLVLVNAIYFKGNWLNKFDAKRTSKEDFHLADGSTKKVDMMHLNKKFKYVWHPTELNANSVTLPYVGDKVSLTILLPEEGTKLEEIESSITDETLNLIFTIPIDTEKVNLQIPKFKLEYKNELSEHFKQLGAQLPFDERNADFTGINEDPQGLYISKVIHQAVVEVNEEGTEAAAATGVTMLSRMALIDEPREFICNRPFLFVIHENVHNTVLFVGKYAKPE